MTTVEKRNLIAQWAFDTRPVLLRFHLWLEDVEIERAQERPLREADLSREELQVLKTYQLLTVKPMLIALNCDESQVAEAPARVREIAAIKEGQQTKVLAFFGKIDLEISELSMRTAS